MPEPTERPFARAFAVGLVLCMAGIGAHTVASHAARPELEQWALTTAVADEHIYPAENPPPLSFHGYALTPLVPQRTHEIRETRVVYVGEDDSKQYRIYKHREEEREGDPEHVYLVKTGQNHFLKLQTPEKK